MTNIDAQLLNALCQFCETNRTLCDLNLPLREKIRLRYSLHRSFIANARAVSRKPPASAS